MLSGLFSRLPRGADQLPLMRLLWIGAFLDLILYAAIAMAVDVLYFGPRLLTGFFNANSDVARVVFYVSGAATVLVGQIIVMAQLHRLQALAAEPVPDELSEMIDAQRWRAFLFITFVAELVGILALVIFLTIGAWRAVAFLLGVGAVFNAQGMPRRSWWNEADRPG
jgi:hypothetical protein